MRTKLRFVALILLLFSINAFGAWQDVGRVTAVTRSKTNGVILDTSSRAKVLVEFVDQNVIRIRMSPSGKFERDFSYAIDYSRDRMTPITNV